MKYISNNLGIRQQIRLDNAEMEASQAVTESEKLLAYIDYVAMMSNIEFSEIEEENTYAVNEQE